MSIFRQLVREHVRTGLIEGDTHAGQNVYVDRVQILDRQGLIPAVCVLSKSETAEPFCISPRSDRLEYTISLELFVRRKVSGELVQDLADELAVQVKSIADQRLSCLSQFCPEIEGLILLPDEGGYRGTEFDFDSRGQIIMGGVQLTYGVVWVEPADFALGELEIRDWLKTHVTAKPAGAAGDDVALLAGFTHPQG